MKTQDFDKAIDRDTNTKLAHPHALRKHRRCGFKERREPLRKGLINAALDYWCAKHNLIQQRQIVFGKKVGA